MVRPGLFLWLGIRLILDRVMVRTRFSEKFTVSVSASVRLVLWFGLGSVLVLG
jgi:hypothetical protein